MRDRCHSPIIVAAYEKNRDDARVASRFDKQCKVAAVPTMWECLCGIHTAEVTHLRATLALHQGSCRCVECVHDCVRRGPHCRAVRELALRSALVPTVLDLLEGSCEPYRSELVAWWHDGFPPVEECEARQSTFDRLYEAAQAAGGTATAAHAVIESAAHDLTCVGLARGATTSHPLLWMPEVLARLADVEASPAVSAYHAKLLAWQSHLLDPRCRVPSPADASDDDLHEAALLAELRQAADIAGPACAYAHSRGGFDREYGEVGRHHWSASWSRAIRDPCLPIELRLLRVQEANYAMLDGLRIELGKTLSRLRIELGEAFSNVKSSELLHLSLWAPKLQEAINKAEDAIGTSPDMPKIVTVPSAYALPELSETSLAWKKHADSVRDDLLRLHPRTVPSPVTLKPTSTTDLPALPTLTLKQIDILTGGAFRCGHGVSNRAREGNAHQELTPCPNCSSIRSKQVDAEGGTGFRSIQQHWASNPQCRPQWYTDWQDAWQQIADERGLRSPWHRSQRRGAWGWKQCSRCSKELPGYFDVSDGAFICHACWQETTPKQFRCRKCKKPSDAEVRGGFDDHKRQPWRCPKCFTGKRAARFAPRPEPKKQIPPPYEPQETRPRDDVSDDDGDGASDDDSASDDGAAGGGAGTSTTAGGGAGSATDVPQDLSYVSTLHTLPSPPGIGLSSTMELQADPGHYIPPAAPMPAGEAWTYGLDVQAAIREEEQAAIRNGSRCGACVRQRKDDEADFGPYLACTTIVRSDRDPTVISVTSLYSPYSERFFYGYKSELLNRHGELELMITRPPWTCERCVAEYHERSREEAKGVLPSDARSERNKLGKRVDESYVAWFDRISATNPPAMWWLSGRPRVDAKMIERAPHLFRGCDGGTSVPKTPTFRGSLTDRQRKPRKPPATEAEKAAAEAKEAAARQEDAEAKRKITWRKDGAGCYRPYIGDRPCTEKDMGRPKITEREKRLLDERRQHIRQIESAKQVKSSGMSKVLKAYVKVRRAKGLHPSADRLKELLVKYREKVITSFETRLELYKIVGGRKRVKRFRQALKAADAGSTEETAEKPTYDYGMHGDAEDEDENEGTRLLDSLPEWDDSVWYPFDT